METKTKLPEFKGKPLIEIPAFIPQVGFLEGNFGKTFLEEYRGRAEYDYQNATALNVLDYRNDVVNGSNPFTIVLANQILRPEGLRTATQADLEKALRIGWDLRRTYEDTGLVLRSEDGPNKYLAGNLMKQVKYRNPKQKLPVMIPLNGLELTLDSDSSYGLAFKLTDESEFVYAPILNEPTSTFNSEDIDEKTGFPTKLGNGNINFYTRNSGLSRLYLYLDRDLHLESSASGLADSNGGGRVVVVSAEATSP